MVRLHGVVSNSRLLLHTLVAHFEFQLFSNMHHYLFRFTAIRQMLI